MQALNGRQEGGERIIRGAGRDGARRARSGVGKAARVRYIVAHLPAARVHAANSIMPETAAVRRKRLLYQSRYRGRLESDLLFGAFAARHLPTLSALQLDRYEALLAESDHDLFAWISGQQPVPARHDHDVFRLLQDCRLAPAGA
jgi:antitoxin CptB